MAESPRRRPRALRGDRGGGRRAAAPLPGPAYRPGHRRGRARRDPAGLLAPARPGARRTPLPWVYGVARNCLAQRRAVAPAGRCGWPRGSPSWTRPRTSSRRPPSRTTQLAAALAALRPDEAELLRLWAWEQLTPSEIAEVLGHHRQRREHPAAPGPRRSSKDQLRKIDGGAGHEGVERREKAMSDDARRPARARLQRGRPGRLPPAGRPERVARLLEDVMSTELHHREPRERHPQPRPAHLAGRRGRGRRARRRRASSACSALDRRRRAATGRSRCRRRRSTELAAPGAGATHAKCMVPERPRSSPSCRPPSTARSRAIDGDTVTLDADALVRRRRRPRRSR